MMASSIPLNFDQTSAPHLRNSLISPIKLHHKPRIQRTGVLVFLSWFMTLAIAAVVEIAPIQTEAPFAFEGEPLLLDQRIPILERGAWMMLSQKEHEIHRRAKAESGTTTTVEIPAPSATLKTTSTSVSASPLPSPFDSSLASNFTGNNGNGACPAFINSFLTNPTFKECYPVSLLLQSSQSFFEAEKSLVRITQVLDASCAANVTFCTSYLTDLAKNLTDASNCGADYQLGNSVVVQAYIGMLSYQALYSATCLTDPDTSIYCFANAVTNLTTPSNMYIYYLPLNISLPATSSPSCSWCLQQTMGIYQSAAASKKQPVHSTYVNAAQQINTMCGPDFVNETLPAEIKTSFGFSSSAEGPSWLLLSSLLLITMRWLF